MSEEQKIVASRTNPQMCENHPDRVATWKYGNDSVGGSGTYFRISHWFCDECDSNWRKTRLVIERC